MMSADKWYLRWLEPIGNVYRGAARARRNAYEQGKRPQRKLPRPVISVGNLTVGGTGKTPLVMYICQQLSGWCNPAVLSRGYGRKQKRSYVRVPEASRLDAKAALFFGDEPVMMARRLSNTSIHLGPNRYKNGLRALDRDPVDVFIMDDGFQHIELHRDLDIVLLDGSEDPRELSVLPAGPLREPVEAIRRADVIVINHCKPDGSHAVDTEWLLELNPEAVVVLARYKVDALIDARTGQEVDVQTQKEKRFFAFCGIARPPHFFTTLKSLDLVIAGSKAFGDHHVFNGRELGLLSEESTRAKADAVITTEKDLTRLDLARFNNQPVYYPRIALDILSGEERMWERIGSILNVG